MSPMCPKCDNIRMCPKCNSTRVKVTRAPYVGPGGYNYLYCKCLKCANEWEEKD